MLKVIIWKIEKLEREKHKDKRIVKKCKTDINSPFILCWYFLMTWYDNMMMVNHTPMILFPLQEHPLEPLIQKVLMLQIV